MSPDAEPTQRGFSTGQRVFGRYTLVGIIGRGGMGVVWRARDETLGEDVALKFLPDVVRWDPGAFEDLKVETRRARQLTHPNIVRIHDFVEDGSGAAISMELVDGRTLTDVRLEKAAKVLDPAEITPWLPQLGAALDYAHTQARVVHRDLKPTNVLLTRDGVVKVTDFGVARGLADSVTRVSMMAAGTLVYMSPQQAMGEEPSPADDIYALGATLYEMLTGKPPFHTGDVRLQLFQRKPDPIAARRAALAVAGVAIPATWEKVIAACLAKEAEARPRTAGEVAAALTSVAVVEKWRPRRPTRREWMLGSLAVALAGTAGALRHRWMSRVSGGPAPEEDPPSPELVAHVTFDDEVRDDCGQLGAVVLNHVGITRDRHGWFDRAGHFAGNSYFEATLGEKTRWGSREPFTVALWVRPTFETNNAVILIASIPRKVGDLDWMISLDSSRRVVGRVSQLHVIPGGEMPLVHSLHALEPDRWSHVALSSDGSVMRLFLNGAEDGREPLRVPEVPRPQAAELRVGGGWRSERMWFVGGIDDLRLYRGAMEEAEVGVLAGLAPARFVPSAGTYGERDDFSAAALAEFGAGTELVDWLEVRAAAGGRVRQWVDSLGLRTGLESLWVSRNRQRVWEGRRHYFVTRFEGIKPDYFQAHDQLGGNLLCLGSWYSNHINFLARIPLPAPTVQELNFADGASAGWEFDRTRVIDGRLYSSGGEASVWRTAAVGATADAVVVQWHGWLQAGSREMGSRFEWADHAGTPWIAECKTQGEGFEGFRITLGRRDKPEKRWQMAGRYGELQHTLVLRDGLMRWRISGVAGGALHCDERLAVPGWKPCELREARLTVFSETGANTWISRVEWQEEFSR